MTKRPDMGAYFYGHELLEEVGLNPQNDKFCDDFMEVFADTEWSKSSPWFPPRPLFLRFDEWDGFCECVKHQRRYFFASMKTRLGKC